MLFARLCGFFFLLMNKPKTNRTDKAYQTMTTNTINHNEIIRRNIKILLDIQMLAVQFPNVTTYQTMLNDQIEHIAKLYNQQVRHTNEIHNQLINRILNQSTLNNFWSNHAIPTKTNQLHQ